MTEPSPLRKRADLRPTVRPVVLLILDGFGAREGKAPDDAIANADMPNWRRLLREHPNTTIDASEHYVGLPDGQMGNSEVGHLNIGAGRVVRQDFTRVEHDIASGGFAHNAVLVDAVETAKRSGGVVHVLGLVSPGGVHSHEAQIAALIDLAAARGVRALAVHAFLDGRDTPPRSAAGSLAFVESTCDNARARGTDARIASVCGRYYAMDRDKRWDRIAAAHALIIDGESSFIAASAAQALERAYARGESDEFVQATAIVDPDSAPTNRPFRMNDGDVVVFMNFRADRARQLTRALTEEGFTGFPRRRMPTLARFVTLTSYGEEFSHLSIAYPPQSVANGYGEYIASLGLAQLRIAETEKYAHVTYFFNGGTESVYPGEERIMVPSPNVATYDLAPAMSAVEVTDRLVKAIRSGRHDAIVCNYANADMVGHTGNFAATVAAVETLDTCIGRVVAACVAVGGEVLITADHGNAEMTHDPQTGQAHTAHTLNVVPLVYVGRAGRRIERGALRDVAPTLLEMLGLPKPAEMTGRSLLAHG